MNVNIFSLLQIMYSNKPKLLSKALMCSIFPCYSSANFLENMHLFQMVVYSPPSPGRLNIKSGKSLPCLFRTLERRNNILCYVFSLQATLQVQIACLKTYLLAIWVLQNAWLSCLKFAWNLNMGNPWVGGKNPILTKLKRVVKNPKIKIK